MVKSHVTPYDAEAELSKRDIAVRSSLSLSPDGEWIAVVVQSLTSGADVECERDETEPLTALGEEMAGSEVVVVNTQTGQVKRPFAAFTCSCWPAWSPDGKQLALLTQSSVRRFPRLTLWSLDEESPRVFDAARASPFVNFQTLRWTSDSRRIVLATASQPLQKPIVTRVSTNEPEELPHLQTCLAVLNVENGELSVFGSTTWTLSWQLSPNERQIAFLRNVQPPDKPQNTQANWRQLVVVNLDNSTEQLVGDPQTDNWGCSFSWSPDGCALAWVAHAHHSLTQLFVATIGESADLRAVVLPEETNFGHMSVGWYPSPAPLWNCDSSAFYLPGHAKLWHFTREGAVGNAIDLPVESGFDWFFNSIIALESPLTRCVEENGEVWLSRPREVWKVDLNTQAVTLYWKKEPEEVSLSVYWIARAFDAQRQTLYTVRATTAGTLTLESTNLTSGAVHVVCTLFSGVDDCEYGTVRWLSWTLPDGTACNGSLLLPVGWCEGDKPPVVMNVYGDDRGSGQLGIASFRDQTNMLIVDGHLLSANGYAVLIPDMPQTDELPASSLVVAGEAAAGALRESGLVDAERIAVMGSSYGGYTTLCLMTGSKLFKAGVAANGIYDLFRGATTSYERGWTETGQGRMHTSVWENPTRYLENSPLYALDKLDAPLLILQGASDKMTYEQGRALFSSLQRLDKQGEMLTYRDAGHGLRGWSIAAQRDMQVRLLTFLQQHLKPSKAT